MQLSLQGLPYSVIALAKSKNMSNDPLLGVYGIISSDEKCNFTSRTSVAFLILLCFQGPYSPRSFITFLFPNRLP